MKIEWTLLTQGDNFVLDNGLWGLVFPRKKFVSELYKYPAEIIARIKHDGNVQGELFFSEKAVTLINQILEVNRELF